VNVLCGDDVAAGARLPPLAIAMAARHIVMGAAASRDWQPQHHDHRHAVERMGLPGIILNTPAQAGWLSRYVTDWSGPRGRIARLRFRMLKPVCPGDTVIARGVVDRADRAAQGWWWVFLTLEVRRGDTVVTEAELLLALPGAHGVEPWRAAAADWQPPPLPAPARRG
jgi:acyl dehydratase